MKYEFFTAEDYVNNPLHVFATEKTIEGKTQTHFHDFFEMEFILDGQGTHVINGCEMELKRGSIYLLAPGNFHKIIMSPELKIVNVMFDESIISRELLSKLRDNHSNISAILSDRELSEAYDLAKGIMNELKEPDPHSALYAKNLLNCLIVKLIRNSGSYSSRTDSQRYDPINRALHYLYENYRDNPTIERVATVCGYTPNYFSKLFVDLTGKCYTDFLNSLKISYAKVLLRSDEYNVSEIAFASGFTSLSNFYRVFKADVGIAPLDYRKTR